MSVVLFWLSHRGSVISVRDGLWVHKGIVHSVVFNGVRATVWIIDNNPQRRCVGYRTLEEFANGRHVWIERPVQSPEESNAIIRNAEMHLGRSYDLFSFNCEHFVTVSLGLESASGQLQAFGLFAAIGVAAVIVASQTRSAG